MRFHGFLVFQGAKAVAIGLHRDFAPEETFARAQLAAMSSVFMDFTCFSRISCGVMDFSGPSSMGLWPPDCIELLALGIPLLDPSWLVFPRF